MNKNKTNESDEYNNDKPTLIQKDIGDDMDDMMKRLEIHKKEK